MRRCRFRVVFAAAVAVFAAARGAIPASAQAPPSEPTVAAARLAVPYVAQTEALCGGAAVSMVAHYWGHRDIHAVDFAPLINDRLHGIQVDDLTQAVEARGWSAWAFSGSQALVTHHLRRGRPLIALLEDGPGRMHYVVVVAWDDTGVVVHDPAVGPYRVVPSTRFARAWGASGNATLLFLPKEGPRATASARPRAISSGCGDLVAEAVALAGAGDLGRAEDTLEHAISACPDSAAPIRELAGLRLRQSRWSEANRLAEQAALLDPTDRHTWRVLAVGRFLTGDTGRALDAWNAVDEPRVDLIDVQGLTRTRVRVVTDTMKLSPPDLLVDAELRHARRRLAELPSVASTRIGYRPSASGRADVDVRVQEQPLIVDGAGDAVWLLGRAAIERHGRLTVSSPTGGGDVWSGEWRWQANRPRVGISVAAPQSFFVGGLWTVDALWERNSFGSRSSGVMSIDTRQHVSLHVGDWIAPDVRFSAGAGLDQWNEGGRHLSLDVELEARDARDRAAVKAAANVWVPLGDEPGFTASSLTAAWRGLTAVSRTSVTTQFGFHSVTGTPPLSLWPRTDTGRAGSTRLRAHPGLRDGIVMLDQLGRVLVGGTVEVERHVGRVGPVKTGLALFVDIARVWGAALQPSGGHLNLQVDVGIGLRFDLLGQAQRLGLDLGRGLRHGGTVVSIGWLQDLP